MARQLTPAARDRRNLQRRLQRYPLRVRRAVLQAMRGQWPGARPLQFPPIPRNSRNPAQLTAPFHSAYPRLFPGKSGDPGKSPAGRS